MTEHTAELIRNYTGYVVTETDHAVWDYIHEAEVQHILNDCNLMTLPIELVQTAELVATGQFLRAIKKKILGDEGVSVVSSVKEGDTTVNFGGVSEEERLDALIAFLTKERDLSCFRRLRW